ncbi:MAG: exonuclease domain-containing protein [Carboxydocellales bacterium]
MQLTNTVGIAGYLDVETTGLSPVSDEIVELALCLFEFRRETGEIISIVDEYVGLRESIKPIPWAASRIHGIYQRDVKGKHLDHGRIEEMLQRAEFLVAHNASFDRGFMIRLFPYCEQKPWLCSMRGINWKQKGFPSAALQRLLAAHQINVQRAHRADDDVQAALKLLAQLDQNGKVYFRELLEKHRAI